MQVQSKTVAPAELLERLGVVAAEVFAIGIEEESDEIGAFRDVIGIVGRARELPGEAVDKALADMAALIAAMRNAESGKEDSVIKDKRVQPDENDAGKQIIQALVDACEWVNEPDEWHKVDGLIHYLEDFWDLKSPANT